MAVAAAAVPRANGEQAEGTANAHPPVRLGMCSYTFRNFDRAQLINFLKQLEISTINLKDAKDHLPSTSAADEQRALDDYKAAGITPTAVGTVSFLKDEDEDIRSKFEYAKRAGVKVIVALQFTLQTTLDTVKSCESAVVTVGLPVPDG